MGMKFFSRAMRCRFDDETFEIFDELISGHYFKPGDFTTEAIRAASEKSSSGRRSKSSKRLIEYLNSMKLQDHAGDYIRGRLLEGAGNDRCALKIYRALFRSNGPVDLKKDSLLRIATIQYRMKKEDDAAACYRLFGLYYPGDARAERYMDLAARIKVSTGKIEEALSIWQELRKREIRTYSGFQAMISEAALRSWTGDKPTAHGILERTIRSCDEGLKPAALYWLYDTEIDREKAKKWRASLLDDYPYSLYSRMIKSGRASFLIDENVVASGSCLDSLEITEKKMFDDLISISGGGGKRSDHPAWEAYFYFLDRGFLDEAEKCGRTLSKIYSHDPDMMMTLYISSRSNGMVGFSTSLLDSGVFKKASSIRSLLLKYPAAYSGKIREQVLSRNIPPALILGVIREESRFMCNAVSGAGAIGLMQLMPKTGRWIGSKLGRKKVQQEEFFDPDFNIEAGVWYLRFLLDRNDGSIVGMLAAYNAGSSRMSGWRKTFEPRRNPLLALEMIGPDETRNYTRKVLDAMAAYELINSNAMEIRCD